CSLLRDTPLAPAPLFPVLVSYSKKKKKKQQPFRCAPTPFKRRRFPSVWKRRSVVAVRVCVCVAQYVALCVHMCVRVFGYVCVRMCVGGYVCVWGRQWSRTQRSRLVNQRVLIW